MEVVNVSGTSGPAQRADAAGLWLVGCGNMAGAMVEGWRVAQRDFSQTVAIRPSGTPVQGVRTVRSITEAGRAPAVAILGFKPQKLDEVAPQLAGMIGKDALLISLLAGVEVQTLRQRFPDAGKIVRVMPNVTVAVRRGVLAVYGEELDSGQRSRLTELLAPLGHIVWCGTEAELGVVGSVAGSGPAYVARFIAALASAGEERGLDASVALTIVRETVFGTGWLAATTGEAMDDIVRRVMSPNGTTQAGLKVLEAELPDLIDRTIAAAEHRASELAAEARSIDSTPSAS